MQTRTELETRAFSKVAWRLTPILTTQLFLELSGPQQRGVRRADDEPRNRADGHAIRRRRRHLVSRILLFRNSEQRRALSRRRACVDSTNHDHVGADLRGNHLRHRREELVLAAVPSGSGRSGIFPGDHLLPRHLVSRRISRADPGVVSGRNSSHLRHRWAHLRAASRHERIARDSPVGNGFSFWRDCRRLLLGIAMLWILADRPEEAAWLSEEETANHPRAHRRRTPRERK